MKKVTMLLSLVLILLFISAPLRFENGYADTSISKENDDLSPSLSYSNGILDDNSFPFIYSEGEDLHWFVKNVIGPNECIPGLLYIKDLLSEEITLVWNQPIVSFHTIDSKLLILTETGVLQEIVSPLNAEPFYSSKNGDIKFMTYTDNYMFFVDGSVLVSYSFETRQFTQLCECTDIAFLFPSDDQTLIWHNEKEEYFVYHVDSNLNIATQRENLVFGQVVNKNPRENSANSNTSTIVSFPFSEYPVGSYYTDDGSACDHHFYTNPCSPSNDNCNCRSYCNSIQCMGFAKYASDRYAHRSTWQAVEGDFSEENITINNSTDAKAALYGLSIGTYVRANTHSFVIVGTSNSGITIYEGNYDKRCGVSLTELTYAQFNSAYTYIECIMEHQLGIARSISNAYHRKDCLSTGCTGYVIGSHYSASVGSSSPCLACGYVGNFSGGNV